MVTPRWLIWATSSTKRGTSVLSSRLWDIEVQDFESTPSYQLMQDTGLEVIGFLSGHLERAQAFIGLGPEPAAQNLRSILKQAVQQAQS